MKNKQKELGLGSNRKQSLVGRVGVSLLPSPRKNRTSKLPSIRLWQIQCSSEDLNNFQKDCIVLIVLQLPPLIALMFFGVRPLSYTSEREALYPFR